MTVGTISGHVLTSPQPNAHLRVHSTSLWRPASRKPLSLTHVSSRHVSATRTIFGNSPRARCNSVAASYAAAEFTADAELGDSAGAMDSDVSRTRTDPSSSVDIRLGLTELSRLRVPYDAGFPFVFQLLRRRAGHQ
jgi:hypothetical protein